MAGTTLRSIAVALAATVALVVALSAQAAAQKRVTPGEAQTARPDCRIKGNINRQGTRIYHVPGGRWYDATIIDRRRGERWFCSEAEARAAGWRRSKR